MSAAPFPIESDLAELGRVVTEAQTALTEARHHLMLNTPQGAIEALIRFEERVAGIGTAALVARLALDPDHGMPPELELDFDYDTTRDNFQVYLGKP